VDTSLRAVIWRQFGAAIDMVERAMAACPDALWHDRSKRPEFWYVAYHTLFYLDLYLSDSIDGFAPPAPFTLDELDPSGPPPEQPYTKDELHRFLTHGRTKCRATIAALTLANVNERLHFPCGDFSRLELMLYNMRHVQHHAAQLNLMLRQAIDSAPGWVARTDGSLNEEIETQAPTE
jgi:hypothetical protein